MSPDLKASAQSLKLICSSLAMKLFLAAKNAIEMEGVERRLIKVTKT